MQIHHVGGIEGCGPTEALAILYHDAHWTIYDADEESLNKTDLEKKDITLINRCISDKDGWDTFHTMKNPSASSMFKPKESAKEYVMLNGEVWGEHTEIIKTMTIEVSMLDTLLEKKEIRPIDVLSMDAQGSELNILNGTDLKEVLAVICEINYSPLYEGQPLAHHIQKKLTDEGFRLCFLYNSQHFKSHKYPKQLTNDGFLTVEEALFIRDPSTLADPVKLLKLSMILNCFKQKDLVTKILLDIEDKITQYSGGYVTALKDFTKEAKVILNG